MRTSLLKSGSIFFDCIASYRTTGRQVATVDYLWQPCDNLVIEA